MLLISLISSRLSFSDAAAVSLRLIYLFDADALCHERAMPCHERKHDATPLDDCRRLSPLMLMLFFCC